VIYIAPVSEENQGALGMSAKGQGRLTESSGSLKVQKRHTLYPI